MTHLLTRVIVIVAGLLALGVFFLAFRGILTTTTTATAFTLLALIASLASLGYQIWRTGLVQAADLLMRFEQNFFGADKIKQRALAAGNLLANPDDFLEAEDILDFFETIAMLTRKKALNLYMVWHTFDYWIERYYAVAAAHIAQAQSVDPNVWADLTWLVPRLRKLGKRKSAPSAALGHNALDAFLREEAAEA
jgi:hypothetical protein